MTGSTAIAVLLLALCFLAGAAVLRDGLKDRRRRRPEAGGWIFVGAYLVAVPSLILLSMVLA